MLSNGHFPNDIREAWLDEFTAPVADTKDSTSAVAASDAPTLRAPSRTRSSRLALMNWIERLSAATSPSHEEVDSIVELISDFGQLMERATDEEQQRILSHFVLRALADLDERVLGGIVPQPAFASLSRRAIDSQPTSELLLVPAEKCGLVGGRGLEPLTFRV